MAGCCSFIKSGNGVRGAEKGRPRKTREDDEHGKTIMVKKEPSMCEGGNVNQISRGGWWGCSFPKDLMFRKLNKERSFSGLYFLFTSSYSSLATLAI